MTCSVYRWLVRVPLGNPGRSSRTSPCTSTGGEVGSIRPGVPRSTDPLFSPSARPTPRSSPSSSRHGAIRVFLTSASGMQSQAVSEKQLEILDMLSARSIFTSNISPARAVHRWGVFIRQAQLFSVPAQRVSQGKRQRRCCGRVAVLSGQRAVSMKLTPRSRAKRSAEMAARSSHWPQWRPLRPQVPMPTSNTITSVRPSLL